MKTVAAREVCLQSIVIFMFILFQPFCSARASASSATTDSMIHDVSVSNEFFLPSIGQSVQFSFAVDRSGTVNVLVLDPDGYPVRTLAQNQPVQAGKLTFDWDGKSEGQIVAAEAYSVKIDFSCNGNTETYFPANSSSQMTAVKPSYYDRTTGTLSYDLAKPSRVHIQAGVATKNPATGEMENEVLMKTIANEEVRASGKIIEHFSGLDESQTIAVADLQHFVIAIAATPLPDNSVIVVNPSKSFVESVAGRKGKSLFTFAVKDHHHHQGLSILESTSPSMKLTPGNAVLSQDQHAWKLGEPILKISGNLQGPNAEAFIHQPGKLLFFLDEKQVSEVPVPKSTNFDLELPLPKLTPGNHIAAFDWISDNGPAAAYSFRLNVGESCDAGVPPAELELKTKLLRAGRPHHSSSSQTLSTNSHEGKQ